MNASPRAMAMAPKPKQPRINPLCKYRAKKGWTQREAAEKLGVSWATYQRLEKMPVLPKVYVNALEGLKLTHGK